MIHILEHLAVGNVVDAESAPYGALLNVAAEVELDPAVVQDRPYLKVPILDMKPVPPFQLQEAVAFLDRHVPDKRVLVVCDGGVGRGPSVVVGYLCAKGMRFGQAVEFVAVRKPYMSILPDLIESVRKAFARPITFFRLDSFSLPSKAADPAPAGSP